MNTYPFTCLICGAEQELEPGMAATQQYCCVCDAPLDIADVQDALADVGEA